MADPSAEPHVSRARGASLARIVRPAVMLAAAAAAGLLVHRVLGRLAGGADAETLARALPGALAEVVRRFAGAPLLPAVFVALLPLVVWVACGALASALRADGARARTGQAIAWAGSLCASLAALATGMTAAKQGLAALGYALAWPTFLSVAAVLWASRLSRLAVVSIVTVIALAGLVVRALPVGWPGENSLSWWPMLLQVPRGPMLLGLSAVAGAAALAVLATTRGLRAPLALRLALLTLVPALLLRALPALEHYGPGKHAATLASEINTSFFQVAGGIGSRDAFVRGYAGRMGTLPMHARTHPPTWPLLFRAATDAGARPAGDRLARFTAWALGADWNASDTLAASVAERPLAPADVSGLWLVVAALALCVLLLPAAAWFLASAFAPPAVALQAAAWCALLPAPLLFFPDVDVAHPLLYALALGAWMRRGRNLAWALAAGALAAFLVSLSLGNLALYLLCAALALLGLRAEPDRARREVPSALLLLLPLAALLLWAESIGARPLAIFAEGIRQHHAILAHRSRALWMALDPLETVVALGIPSVLWLALHIDLRALWRGARGATLGRGELLLAGALFTLLVLDLSGQTLGESGRLWMGFFPAVLAGASPLLAERERDWPRLALLVAATLVVLKGFYVFVWLYMLR